jgi:predicted amidohydrolase
LWIVAGSVPCLERKNGEMVLDDKVRASCFVYNDLGQQVGRYDKIHLFDVTVADKQAQYQESATFEAGDEVVVIKTPFANIGLTICYDLRFPQLFQALRDQGADIIVVPAAFTALTGKAHWQVLLQARAIETQCFIVGAGTKWPT